MKKIGSVREGVLPPLWDIDRVVSGILNFMKLGLEYGAATGLVAGAMVGEYEAERNRLNRELEACKRLAKGERDE